MYVDIGNNFYTDKKYKPALYVILHKWNVTFYYVLINMKWF